MPYVLVGVLVVVSGLLGLAVRNMAALEAFREKHKDFVWHMNNHATMSFVTVQIVIGLSKVHEMKGGSEYPYPIRDIVRAAEGLTLDLPAFFHLPVRQQFCSAPYGVHTYAFPPARHPQHPQHHRSLSAHLRP